MVIFSRIGRWHFVMALTAYVLLTGCRKSDMVADPGIEVMKVYYDTMANADNYAVSMDAGYGRIFMAYGTSPLGLNNSYGIYTQTLRSALMATDNDGNLLWKVKIPDAMEENAVVALEDGGCLLITQYYEGKNPKYTNKNVYFFRYDANGNLSKVDSVAFVPEITDYMSMMVINAFKKPNGNIIVYGDVMTLVNFVNYTKGWVLEYSLTSGVVWRKTHLYKLPGTDMNFTMFSGCAPTSDNGLLFFGNYIYIDTSNYSAVHQPYLVKTNATGDTMWTKMLPRVRDGLYPGNIVKTPKGTYRFCYSVYTNDITKPTDVFIHEINESGDSLNAVRFNSRMENFVSKILMTPDGGCFALMNAASGNSIGYTRRLYFTKTNTLRVWFDAGLNLSREMPFQGLSTDFITQACYTSDGKIACFGLQQPPGRTYYLPNLYILK